MKKLFVTLLIIAILASMTVLLGACGNGSLKGATLTCEDGVLRIENPNADTHYKAVVNGEEQEINDRFEIKLPEKLNQLKVKLFGYNDSNKEIGVIEKDFTMLPAVTVNVVDGYYDWSASDAEIKNNYPNETVKYVVLMNSDATVTADNKIAVPTGLNTIRVRPYFEGKKDVFGAYSDPVNCNVLATPDNLVFDGSFLTWGPVDFATMQPSYAVKVNQSEPVIVNSNYINMVENFPEIFEDAAKKAAVTISVRSVATSDLYVDSAYTQEKTYAVLDAIENLHFNETAVEWTANEFADSYLLIVNDGSAESATEIVVEDTRYELNVLSDRQISVKVKANVKDSIVVADWSKEIRCTFLQAPELKFENGMFYWDIVTNAEGYIFCVDKLEKVNGEFVVVEGESVSIDLSRDAFSIAYDFAEEGFYNAYVYSAARESATYVNSGSSNVIEVTKLTAPKNFFLKEDLKAVDLGNQSRGSYKMTISFDPIADNRAYYQLLLDGTTISTGSTENNFSFTLPSNVTEREYRLEVRAVSFNEGSVLDGKLVLSANRSLIVNICKLAIPDNVGVNEKSQLIWDEVDKASSYAIYTGASLTEGIHDNVYAFGSADSGSYRMRVSARGDVNSDATKFVAANSDEASFYTDVVNVSSDFSNLYYLTKLAVPDELRIMDGSYLSWHAVDGAVGYTLKVNVHSSNDGVSGKTFDLCAFDGKNYNSLITTSSARLLDLCYLDGDVYKRYELSEYGCAFTVIAVGNRGEDLLSGQTITIDSNAASTQTLFRLGTPTGLRAEDRTLSWTAPASKDNVTSYSVYDGDYLIGNVIGTSFDISTIDQGKHYFTVVAEGDNATYFASGVAALVNGQSDDYGRYITKLSAINQKTLGREGGRYVWDKVEGAVLYKITVGTQELSYFEVAQPIGDTAEFEPNFNNFKTPTVSIYAKGDNETTIDSAVYEFIQTTRTLDTPSGAGLVSVDMVDGILSLRTTAVNQGNGFIFYLDKIARPFDSENEVCKVGADMIGEHTVTISAKGNYFDADGVYCFESLTSSQEFNFKCLSSVDPDSVKIAPVKDDTYQITWKSLDEAKYRFYYTVTNADNVVIEIGTYGNGDGADLTGASCTIVSPLAKGNNLNLYILSIGNGGDVFSISYEYTVVTKRPQ